MPPFFMRDPVVPEPVFVVRLSSCEMVISPEIEPIRHKVNGS